MARVRQLQIVQFGVAASHNLTSVEGAKAGDSKIQGVGRSWFVSAVEELLF
jgi:hypothetical protein